MFPLAIAFNWLTFCVFLAAVLYLLWERFIVSKPKKTDTSDLPKEIRLITGIVEELYPLFKPLKEIRRLSRSEFISFCHSSLSGGISRQLRNDYNMWVMYTIRMTSKHLRGEVTNKQALLYDTLAAMYSDHAHPFTGKKYIHPDEASARLVGIIYDYFHLQHPDACLEVQRSMAYRNSSEYEPSYPFDVRYPDEKPQVYYKADRPDHNSEKGGAQ